MKEKELRLALVCYGGVSFAIYEHGITKEILKLVRASHAYHAQRDLAVKQGSSHTYRAVRGDDPECSTEEIYFDLLKAIGGELDLRVFVDVITGSSAGGVNGIALARALAHDLSFEPLTDLWLNEADIEHMLAPEAMARQWSKWYFHPFLPPLLWRLDREGLLPATEDGEMRSTLSSFVRSRWFQPPFDGPKFCAQLLDGLLAMGAGRAETGSLLPTGQRLDLVVTVTDFHGSPCSIFMHDPPVVHEREHRHVLRFFYEHLQGSAACSELGRDHIPSLAFAARATASYPGAFPPAQLGEMDAVLARRGEPWPGRARFLATNFRHYADAGIPAEEAVLVDGSVLNNKPLHEAMAAARTHRAFREVDRRLLYVDPHPGEKTTRKHRVPGFFTTLRGALSDLPRTEPIHDELVQISAYNDQVRQRLAVVEAVKTHVTSLVLGITGNRLDERIEPEDLRHWRLGAPAAGLIHSSYVRLLIDESIDMVAHLVARCCDYRLPSPQYRWLKELLGGWVRKNGMYDDSHAYPATNMDQESAYPPSAFFILDFGVSYKRRRIAFVIQVVNHLYHRRSEGMCQADPAALDLVKRRLYRCLDALRVYDDVLFLGIDTVKQIRTLFGQLPEVGPESVLPDPGAFLAVHEEQINAVMQRLSNESDLRGLSEEVETVLASSAVHALGPACQRDILISFLGFMFWDMVLQPMMTAVGARDTNALEEILVDRISPQDATSLRLDDAGPVLRGGALAGFGGFFSRASRENDYLWGRLHAVERLFALVASTAAREITRAGVDVAALRRRCFESVLREEKPRLSHVAQLIERLQAKLAAM